MSDVRWTRMQDGVAHAFLGNDRGHVRDGGGGMWVGGIGTETLPIAGPSPDLAAVCQEVEAELRRRAGCR